MNLEKVSKMAGLIVLIFQCKQQPEIFQVLLKINPTQMMIVLDLLQSLHLELKPKPEKFLEIIPPKLSQQPAPAQQQADLEISDDQDNREIPWQKIIHEL
jgi:hypothetical protein